MSKNLYIVPVPIGNLKDITLRGIEILQKVDFIIAEDTRYSRKLLTHLGIKKRIVSYFKHREKEKSIKILHELSRLDAALITDSGTPLISDPGYILIKAAIDRDINVIPLPGPTAFLPALVASGIFPGKFNFLGFPPRQKKKLHNNLEQFCDLKQTLIFFESPRRIEGFLATAFEVLGDRQFAIAKEISKKNEKIIRGNLKNLNHLIQNEILLGEMVVIIEGSNSKSKSTQSPKIENLQDIFDYFKHHHAISKNELKKALMKR